MPDRITLSRASGWRKPAGAVIVSRPSIWGNPWSPGNPGRLDALDTRYRLMIPLTQSGAVLFYRLWLTMDRLPLAALPDMTQLTDAGQQAMRDHLYGRRGLILSEIHQLRGRDLCCWCKPGTPCHADTLMEIANG